MNETHQIGTHVYQVGTLYHPSQQSWADAVQYRFRGGEHELVTFAGDVSDNEVTQYRQGALDLALYVFDARGPIILAFRLGDLPWSDAAYTWHLEPEGERTAPAPVAIGSLTPLTVMLVDGETGILKVIRQVGVPSHFVRPLNDAIEAQMAAAWDRAEYDRLLRVAYQTHPESGSFAGAAVVRWRGLAPRRSTAPWDQPRNGTTITLHRADWETATEEELLAQLREESPDMVDPRIEHVNWRRADEWTGGVCCLISWKNTRAPQE